MSERYDALVGIMDDPLNLLCFIREFQRRKVGKFLLPPVPRSEGGWVLIPLKEAFKFSKGIVLPKKYTGDVYYQIWNDGSNWFALNPRTEEEVGPFDSSSVALKEAIDLASSEGLTVLPSWPWDAEDLSNYPM